MGETNNKKKSVRGEKNWIGKTPVQTKMRAVEKSSIPDADGLRLGPHPTRLEHTYTHMLTLTHTEQRRRLLSIDRRLKITPS